MIELDVDKRREAANKEEAKRDAIVRSFFRDQSPVVGERSNLPMGGDQQYSVFDPATGRTFIIKDTRVIRKADPAADVRRQLRDAGVILKG